MNELMYEHTLPTSKALCYTTRAILNIAGGILYDNLITVMWSYNLTFSMILPQGKRPLLA